VKLMETTLEPVALPVRPSVPPRDNGVGERPCAIRVSDLCKAYPVDGSSDTISALCGLDLEVPPGQHIAVLGSSGSGKSTLLGCLSGRLTPTRGRIDVQQQRIATIHQDLRLVKHRTALDNVLHGSLGRQPLWRTLFSFPRAEKERAMKLLKRVGLGQRARWPVGRLSGGEQQRVAIARALMQKPQIILADEPVAALDNDNARHIMQLLTDLSREHKLTLVSVLHDCALAENFADRIIGLDGGKVIFDGLAGQGTSYEQCRACPTMRQAIAQRPPAPPPREWPLWVRALRWAAIFAGAVLVYALAIRGLNLSARHLEGAPRGMMNFLAAVTPASLDQLRGIAWGPLFAALLQTLGMSLIGTTLGIMISWPLSALAAKNVGPRGIRHVMRFTLNTIRTIPSLIWALLFVAAVGLGPFTGVLALTAYSIGYLTKFFYEEFEAVDPGPPSALKEIGAGGLQQFFHAVWPASRPGVLSSCLFMFEYNVRAASVLGIVGAGGIGFYFHLYFEQRDFTAVLACLVLLLIVVIALDAISTRLRARLVQV